MNRTDPGNLVFYIPIDSSEPRPAIIVKRNGGGCSLHVFETTHPLVLQTTKGEGNTFMTAEAYFMGKRREAEELAERERLAAEKRKAEELAEQERLAAEKREAEELAEQERLAAEKREAEEGGKGADTKAPANPSKSMKKPAQDKPLPIKTK